MHLRPDEKETGENITNPNDLVYQTPRLSMCIYAISLLRRLLCFISFSITFCVATREDDGLRKAVRSVNSNKKETSSFWHLKTVQQGVFTIAPINAVYWAGLTVPHRHRSRSMHAINRKPFLTFALVRAKTLPKCSRSRCGEWETIMFYSRSQQYVIVL